MAAHTDMSLLERRERRVEIWLLTVICFSWGEGRGGLKQAAHIDMFPSERRETRIETWLVTLICFLWREGDEEGLKHGCSH